MPPTVIPQLSPIIVNVQQPNNSINRKQYEINTNQNPTKQMLSNHIDNYSTQHNGIRNNYDSSNQQPFWFYCQPIDEKFGVNKLSIRSQYVVSMKTIKSLS